MNAAEAQWIRDLIRKEIRSGAWSGVVVEKLTNPLRLLVSQDNYYTPVECIADVGVWGQARVGSPVHVRNMGGVNVAQSGTEILTARNQMQIVGEDTSVGSTTSVTAWEELLRVEDLAIAPAGFAICHITAEAQRIGSSPSTQKQLRFLINDEPSVAYNIGATDSFEFQSITIPLWIGAFSAGLNFEDRIFGFLSGTNLTAVAEAEINTISIEGRTQDTGSGDDIVRATNLLVFA